MGFSSRSLVRADVDSSTSDREFLPVVWSLKTLCPYLLYVKFIVHTNYAPLHSLMTIDDPRGLLMCWRLCLEEYDFKVRYKSGKAKTEAYSLLGLPIDGETVLDDTNDIRSFYIDD